MEILERIWELVSGFFAALAVSIERSITSLFGSSNARYIKKLQAKVDAINALEPKFQALTNDELRARLPSSAAAWPPARRSMICWSRPLPPAANPAAASWACGITTFR